MDKYPSYFITNKINIENNKKYTKIINFPQEATSIIVKESGLYFTIDSINSDLKDNFYNNDEYDDDNNLLLFNQNIGFNMGYENSSYVYHGYCKKYSNGDIDYSTQYLDSEAINGFVYEESHNLKKLKGCCYDELINLFDIQITEGIVNVSFKEKNYYRFRY